jgi:hypothetical protein
VTFEPISVTIALATQKPMEIIPVVVVALYLLGGIFILEMWAVCGGFCPVIIP